MALFVTYTVLPYSSEAQDDKTASPAETNGIYAEVSFFPSIERDQSLTVNVSVVNTNVYGFWGQTVSEPKDAHDIAHSPLLKAMLSDSFLYFTPTNPFYDAIQLQDATGKTLPLFKAYASTSNSYPALFSLAAARKNNSYASSSEPRPLKSSRDTLAQFQLEDYFKIEESGNYKLTVWPKIYKRASTNDDICHRIDLPPVTVVIKWEGQPSK